MSGAFGTVVLTSVISGLLLSFDVVEVASASGMFVLVSVSFLGIVTAIGVGSIEVLTSVPVSFSGVGVVIIVKGGLVSLSVSSSGGKVRDFVIGEVIGKVIIELVVMMKV